MRFEVDLFGLNFSIEAGEEDPGCECVEYEDGLFQLCPACDGEGENEHGQPCVWCLDREGPAGMVPHEGCEHGD